MKHRHRVVLEIQSNVPISDRDVRHGVALLLSRIDGPKWLRPWPNDATQLMLGEIKSFNRVFGKEFNRRVGKHEGK